MENSNDIGEWRRLTRVGLRATRSALLSREKERVKLTICEFIQKSFPQLRYACIGFYWPIQGEIDLRDLVRNFVELGAEAALPVVVKKGRPLEFWSWQPEMKLIKGIWNIPIPSEQNLVHPTHLLVPLVGFDAAAYRLGHGGGYYDRTLAKLSPRPSTIGVGYEVGRLETIYPQPHDIPMDAIVTENGVSLRIPMGL